MPAAAVKSAQRVLELLDFFAQHRRVAGVGEISRHFGWPLSSTSVLLASLEGLGYLRHDETGRGYRPTLRVMLLGAWLHDEIFGEGSLVSMMEGLRRQTGLTVLLGMRQGVHLRLILVLRGLRPDAVQLAAGLTAPLCLSALGHMLMLGESEAEVGRILRRSNAGVPAPQRLRLAELLRMLEEARRQGWTARPAVDLPGRAVVAVALPRMMGQPDLAIGLGAPAEDLRNPVRLVAALQQACADIT